MSGIGALGVLQISQQGSFGTLDVASLTAIPIMTENMNLEIGQLVEDNMYQRFGESPSHEGPHQVTGSVACQPEPSTLGWLLKAACGQADVPTSDTNTQTHKFRPLDSADWDERASLQPFTVLTDRDVTSGMAYQGCLANQLALEASNGELLSATIDWIGASYQDAANVAPSFSDDAPWTWDTASISFAGILNAASLGLLISLCNGCK